MQRKEASERAKRFIVDLHQAGAWCLEFGGDGCAEVDNVEDWDDQAGSLLPMLTDLIVEVSEAKPAKSTKRR